MSRPWSECAAAPAAIMRTRCRAAIVSALAPQTPTCGPLPNGSMRQGPMLQCRQHRPSVPKPHWGCCASQRSQTVWMFCSAARWIIT